MAENRLACCTAIVTRKAEPFGWEGGGRRGDYSSIPSDGHRDRNSVVTSFPVFYSPDIHRETETGGGVFGCAFRFSLLSSIKRYTYIGNPFRQALPSVGHRRDRNSVNFFQFSFLRVYIYRNRNRLRVRFSGNVLPIPRADNATHIMETLLDRLFPLLGTEIEIRYSIYFLRFSILRLYIHRKKRNRRIRVRFSVNICSIPPSRYAYI